LLYTMVLSNSIILAVALAFIISTVHGKRLNLVREVTLNEEMDTAATEPNQLSCCFFDRGYDGDSAQKLCFRRSSCRNTAFNRKGKLARSAALCALVCMTKDDKAAASDMPSPSALKADARRKTKEQAVADKEEAEKEAAAAPEGAAEEDAAAPEMAAEEEASAEAARYVVLHDGLKIFKSCESKQIVGTLKKGDTVASQGDKCKVGNAQMLYIEEPHGGVVQMSRLKKVVNRKEKMENTKAQVKEEMEKRKAQVKEELAQEKPAAKDSESSVPPKDSESSAMRSLPIVALLATAAITL